MTFRSRRVMEFGVIAVIAVIAGLWVLDRCRPYDGTFRGYVIPGHELE